MTQHGKRRFAGQVTFFCLFSTFSFSSMNIVRLVPLNMIILENTNH